MSSLATARTATLLVAALGVSGCYRSHGRDEPPRDLDAGLDAGPLPPVVLPDAGPPELDCDALDPLALAATIEELSEVVGLRLDGDPEGEGTLVALDAGVARIRLDDGREATFTVTDATMLDRFSVMQSVRVARRGAWDAITDGSQTVAVHASTVFQVSIPPFEPMDGISRAAAFELDPRCAVPIPSCGADATATASALLVDFPGDPDLYLLPNERAERGGIDRWEVHFRGAVELVGGVDACSVGPGLHAIVEVRFEMICIC